MSEEELRPQSEFNMSISYLNRLNEWFYVAGHQRYSYNARKWFDALISIFSELSTQMKSEELKKLMLEIKTINKELLHIDTKKKIPHELWSRLHLFELELRRITNDSGLEIKKKPREGEDEPDW